MKPEPQQLLILIPLALSTITQLFTDMKSNDYEKGLMLQPPSYVFGIAWTTIYLLFGAYLYNVVREKEPCLYWILGIYGLNLLINMAWSPIVFNMKMYKMGAYLIVLMMATLIMLFVSTKGVISKNLLVPYISWLILALLLNVELVRRKQASSN